MTEKKNKLFVVRVELEYAAYVSDEYEAKRFVEDELQSQGPFSNSVKAEESTRLPKGWFKDTLLWNNDDLDVTWEEAKTEVEQK